MWQHSPVQIWSPYRPELCSKLVPDRQQIRHYFLASLKFVRSDLGTILLPNRIFKCFKNTFLNSCLVISPITLIYISWVWVRKSVVLFGATQILYFYEMVSFLVTDSCKPLGPQKMHGIYWLAEKLLDPEGLCSMEFVRFHFLSPVTGTWYLQFIFPHQYYFRSGI